MAQQRKKTTAQMKPSARRPSGPDRPSGRVQDPAKSAPRSRSFGARQDSKRQRRTRILVILVVVALIVGFAAGILAVFLGDSTTTTTTIVPTTSVP